MGVPQFFTWITRKYKKIISSDFSEEVNALYFDFNCLIYHVWRGIYDEKYEILKDKNKNYIEKEIIEGVIKYMKYIIFNVVKPTKFVYIGIDGAVPRAKMNQQRFRRYKRDMVAEMDKQLKEKFGMFKKELWDTNCITPGTVFMNDLSCAIKETIKNSFGVDGCALEFFLSDASVPGEGEHKVMNHLRRQTSGGKEKYVVYGLDADLIFLTLISGMNIVLLRENTLRGGISEFLWVDDTKLGEAIVKEFKNKMMTVKVDPLSIIRDYCFLGFLVGNDFCHSTPSINIGENGVDMLVSTYCKFFSADEYLIGNGYTINQKFLESILHYIARGEMSNLQYLQKKRGRKLNVPSGLDAYEEEKYMRDRIPLNDDFKRFYGVIDYNARGWKEKYYELLLDNANIEDVVQKYIEGLIFTKQYYFERKISWEWYNPHLNAPFMSCVWNYLCQNKIKFNDVKIEEGVPYTAYEQLLMVLPPQNHELLPECLGHGMVKLDSPIIEYYPKKFQLDLYEKFMLYSAEPILPLIDSANIRDFFKENEEKLNEKEKLLNKKGAIVYFKRK